MNRIRCLGIVMVLSVGCATADDGLLTYDEFKTQAYHEADTGVWVVNGDEAYETEAQLAWVYGQYLESFEAAATGIGTSAQELAVYNTSATKSPSGDVRWTASQVQNLTYCVSQASFGSRYSAVVSAMAAAASNWHGAEANVQFVHVASADTDCTSRTNSVLFNVRQVQTSQYLARSFFPNSSRRGREVLISASSFGNIKPWTLGGILTHELGHTLGFRHEHTRPEAGACFEDNQWRGLTNYDSSSVMHYPQCNGTQNGDLVLTSLDKTGVSLLY